ncbi:MAG: hypothetical protein VXB01_11920 [Opitutae bacterium]
MPFEWNMDYFSLSGYASVMALVLVFTLWVIHFIFKPQQIVCYLAMGMAIMAFSLGKHNSLTYVNKIQPDRSQQKAELEAKIAAEQQAVLDQRGVQVAQIRFAEDAEDEFLDRAGLDDEDLENLDNIREELTPDWKREKKKRSASTEGSEGEGMDTAAIEESSETEPIVMLEADLMRANHFDYWNLQISKWCMGLGLLIILYDYIRRHNRYESAYFPLKIPSALANLVTPYPSVVDRSSKPRRSVPDELAWLTKRGDPFVYFSSNSANTKEVDEALVSFFGKKKNSLQIIKTSTSAFTDNFAFESWWFGRSSVIVQSKERSESMIGSFLDLLEGRSSTRARVRQTAHLVWDLESPIPQETQTRLEQLAARTGFSLLLCKNYE